MTRTRRANPLLLLLVLGAAAALLAGCGERDPGAIGPTGVDGGLSGEGQRQEYMDGVGRALQQLGTAQGEGFEKAVDSGNAKQLEAASIAWSQGGAQLKQLDPPKDVAAQHLAMVKAVDGLSTWNQRIAKAAPNKAMTRKLARQAAGSPPSKAFEAAVCDIVNAGYDVIDPGACTPLANAEPAG